MKPVLKAFGGGVVVGAAFRALPAAGRVLVGVGLLGAAVRLLGGRRRWLARRAGLLGRYGAGRPLPIDGAGYQPGLAAGPVHTVALA